MKPRARKLKTPPAWDPTIKATVARPPNPCQLTKCGFSLRFLFA